VINLTPHAIVIRLIDGTDSTIPPSGVVARVIHEEKVTGYLHGVVPIITRVYMGVHGLPEGDEPVLVSSMVLSALPAGSPGVYAPDTGSTAIRDDRGHVVAVTRLVGC
jgi:hypothetical protein